VRAVLESLTTRLLVRCRLVERVSIAGPIQFILGDSALSQPRSLVAQAYSPDGRPVSIFTVRVGVADSRVAMLRGTTLYPRSRGSTVVSVHVGDREAGTGVHIYQRVESLDALDTLLLVHPKQRSFAVPLRLEAGRQYRQSLPPGHWMLAMLPAEDHGQHPIRMELDSAVCALNLLNDPRRLGCEAGSRATVVVYRPSVRDEPAMASGYLLVRWLHSPNPARFVPRVPAAPGSLDCAEEFLAMQGYAVRIVSSARHLLRAGTRESRLGTAARREWIEVQLVSDAPSATLRARAWAVDSYPTFGGEQRASSGLVVEPAEVTVTDAREALQRCRRG